MQPVTVSPLHKHRGHNGGLLALGVLASATAVVWATSPREPVHPHAAMTTRELAPGAQRKAPAKPAVAAVAHDPERTPPAQLEQDPAIRTVIVGERDFAPQITATGVATYDEQRTTHLGAPVAGWMQKARASSLGRNVKQGETLAVIYSPEVYLATVDLIKEVADFHSQDDLNRERYRLLRWGMPRALLDRIEQTQQPTGVLPLVVRYPGVVVAEQGERAQLVDAYGGREYFTVTPAAFAWAFVDVREADAPRVKVGTKAQLTIQGVRKPVATPVAYVWHRGEDGMRKVRFDIYNPGMRPVTPNAWVKAELTLERVRAPAVPEAAVITMGMRTYVYVARDRSIAAREVRLGERVGGYYRVESGVATGDVIALGIKL